MKNAVKSVLFKPLRGYRRLLSIGVSALLSAATFFTVIPQTETIVYADNDKTISGLCTGAIADSRSNPGTITKNGTTITVPYTITGSNAANATQVSVLIMDSHL